MLTLRNALEQNKVADFIAQEEARGIGPTDPRALDALVAEAAKERRSEDQASHSPSDDGSTGK